MLFTKFSSSNSITFPTGCSGLDDCNTIVFILLLSVMHHTLTTQFSQQNMLLARVVTSLSESASLSSKVGAIFIEFNASNKHKLSFANGDLCLAQSLPPMPSQCMRSIPKVDMFQRTKVVPFSNVSTTLIM